jgi:hypothetical protein
MSDQDRGGKAASEKYYVTTYAHDLEQLGPQMPVWPDEVECLPIREGHVPEGLDWRLIATNIVLDPRLDRDRFKVGGAMAFYWTWEATGPCKGTWSK